MTKHIFLLGTLTSMISPGSTYALDCDKGTDSCLYSNSTGPGNAVVVERMGLLIDEHLYHIQPETSKMQFRVDSPVGDIWGNFEEFQGGFAMLDAGVHTDPAFVDVSAESLDTDSSFVGMMLKSESFFDVENFPRIRFVGSSFEWFNKRQAVLKGEMTIQNVTKPVAFYVELVDADIQNKYQERIYVKASTTIRRSEFGIYTLLPIVSDDVNLYMHVDALKKKKTVSNNSRTQITTAHQEAGRI